MVSSKVVSRSGRNRSSKTIYRLKVQHHKLLEQLKSLGGQVQNALLRRQQKNGELHKPLRTTIALDSLLEALAKEAVVNKTELETLETKMRHNTGPQRILELENAIAARQLQIEELCKTKGQAERRIRETQQRLSRLLLHTRSTAAPKVSIDAY